jgi:hypothetical protein
MTPEESRRDEAEAAVARGKSTRIGEAIAIRLALAQQQLRIGRSRFYAE